MNLGQQPIAGAIRFDKRVPHPLDTFAHRGEVDRHFVGKRSPELPVGRRLSFDGNPRIIDAPILFHDVALG